MNDKVRQDLSPDQLRKIILLNQGLYKGSGRSKRADGCDLLSAIEQLGYIQIDTISVVERAHHHTLWNRVVNYQPNDLQQLLEQRQVFEYWSHAAAYLPMRDYRFSLPRKEAIQTGEKHWFEKNKTMTSAILGRIEAEGPLKARDFEQSSGRTNGWWDWKPAKKALEQLFMEGRLMVARREGFQKVYDLTERVLPPGIDTSMPDRSEYCEFLIISYLKAHGLARPEHFGYLLRGFKADLKKRAAEMEEEGRLIALQAGRLSYLALPETLTELPTLITTKISRKRVVILSPFDNLIIQRQRIKKIFNFDYSLECYLPKAKREYGYFCLPLLWGRSFAGRMDVKMDRKSGVLTVLQLHLETSKVEEFLLALKPALVSYLKFNQGGQLVVNELVSHKVSLSQPALQALKRVLNQ